MIGNVFVFKWKLTNEETILLSRMKLQTTHPRKLLSTPTTINLRNMYLYMSSRLH